MCGARDSTETGLGTTAVKPWALWKKLFNRLLLCVLQLLCGSAAVQTRPPSAQPRQLQPLPWCHEGEVSVVGVCVQYELGSGSPACHSVQVRRAVGGSSSWTSGPFSTQPKATAWACFTFTDLMSCEGQHVNQKKLYGMWRNTYGCRGREGGAAVPWESLEFKSILIFRNMW